MTANFDQLLGVLTDAGVEFILIGGVAATIHGSARLTRDVDIVYRRSPENMGRLILALGPLSPYLRGAPPGLPFAWDERTIRTGLNFTLSTSKGDLDLLGEMTGGGPYEALLAGSIEVQVFGRKLRCLSLPQLIAAKRAAGRPKDLEALAELEALRRGTDPHE